MVARRKNGITRRVTIAISNNQENHASRYVFCVEISKPALRDQTKYSTES